jgi:hypothetical protein
MYNAFTFQGKGLNISELSNEETQIFVEKIMILIRHSEQDKLALQYYCLKSLHSHHTKTDRDKY